MGKKRRNFSGTEKAKILLESLKERQTLSEIAQKFEVHPVQVSSCKKEAREHLGEFFSDKRRRDKAQEEQSQLVERLSKEVEQLQVERIRPTKYTLWNKKEVSTFAKKTRYEKGTEFRREGCNIIPI